MRAIAALLLLLLSTACKQSAAEPFESADVNMDSISSAQFVPTLRYKRESIQEFTVLINPEVLGHSEEVEQLRKELNVQLTALNRVMPSGPLTTLRKPPIWVEWEKRKDGAAEFHVSAEWLKANGYNPDKAGSVEISNTRNFVAWSRAEQPWMVLHELSHVYDHLALESRQAEIRAAYEHAMDENLYESVAYINGGERRAYALSNHDEYFAELSEAYFGKNDFFPFTRAELQTYDPVGFRLMENTWGKLHGAD